MIKFLTPLKMGNPILLQKANYVDNPSNSEIQDIVSNMLHTIQTIGERVGLAAPQVGIQKRIIVYRVPEKPLNSRYHLISDEFQKEVPWSALINPEIFPIESELESGWEGCISVPGLLGKVPRYKTIRFTGVNERGQVIDQVVSNFYARLIQHEYDHLEGILFPMKINDPSCFGYEEEIIAHLKD